MSTSAISSLTSNTPSTTSNNSMNLKPSDFINMMVTQLQNQDPLQPTSSQDLLTQMSQIGQLQSSTDLQTSLQTLVLQDNVSAASNMIGKTVKGQDSQGNPMAGKVNSVHVANGQVSLELDSGQELSLSNVTDVTPAAAAGATATPTGTPAASN
jgi:flagellar basal-body rod modification protein FlgD